MNPLLYCSLVLILFGVLSVPESVAVQCYVPNSNIQYTIEPGSDSIFVNDEEFYLVKEEENSSERTVIHSTWWKNSSGVIVLLSVQSSLDSNEMRSTIHYVQGETMTIGECN